MVQPLPGVEFISHLTRKAPFSSGSIVYTPVVRLPDLYKASQLLSSGIIILGL